ncbi:MAG: DUF1588 domain-containing protein, partial [Verrucomicrobia bacterium]|nr:DUF1588 domain-containing protein [Verrucomicrobiota bacterium]
MPQPPGLRARVARPALLPGAIGEGVAARGRRRSSVQEERRGARRPARGAGLATIRQQLEQLRAQERCAGCHARIDPAGFALESFGVLGGARDR